MLFKNIIIYKNKLLFVILSVIYILVPLLICCNKTLFNLKFYILTIIGIFIYIIIKLFKITNNELGINTKIYPSLKHNIPIIITFILLIIFANILGYSKYIPNENSSFYLFYIFISCPIQEFLYRGTFGYFEKNLIKNKFIILAISSFYYSFIHIIYKDLFVCLITFFMGIVWYWVYRKDFNLFGVCISHIILGIMSLSLGIID